jgi:ATP-dependent DNA helicase RecQ
MQYLIRALDGDPTGITQPPLPPLPITVDQVLVREAIAFLRRTSLPIEPRKAWPGGGLPHYSVSGRLAVDVQAQPGKALCVCGDAGWGALVREGKYSDGRFDDQLVTASAALVRAWNPTPAPAWVTCIPSLRHPNLVQDFAQRLANALGLPFLAALTKSDERPEQKTMANSTQQARNVDGSLAIAAEAVRPGPVLLIDDMVDSRWTLTIAAWLLRKHGSGEVWPLALAQTGGGE